MSNAASNVMKMPCQRPPLRVAAKMRVPRAYLQIDGGNEVSYGLEDVSPYDAHRLLKATLALAEWLTEVGHGEANHA